MNRYEQLFSSPIGRDIDRYAAEPSVLFVFPSQDSADSWAAAAVRAGRCGAIALDRFFGFENFLRFCALTSMRAEEREPHPLDRWRWALETLAERESAPEALNAPSAPKVAFAEESRSIAQLSRLVNLVPSLYESSNIARAAEAARSTSFACIQEEAAELAGLAERYRTFLRANAIADGHFPPFALPRGSSVRAYGLDEECARLGFGEVEFPEVAASEAADRPLRYLQFDSFLNELEWVFGAIAGEIDSGEAPEDIVVSVCRMNAQKAAWIRQIAADTDIRVSIRWGEPLAGTPFGRLLGAIKSAAAEGLTLESLDAFAAFTSVRERDAAGWKALRDGAAKAHIPATSPHAPYIHRLWKEALQAGLLPEYTANLYTRLWKDIGDIAGAASFAALYDKILGFMESWVDTTRFGADARTDSAMRMALNELQTWVGAEGGLSRGDFAPFDLYVAELGSKAYIPLLEPGAVRVYDTQASSGMASLSHYIIGASQSGFAQSLSAATSLPASLAALIGTEDRDRAPRVLAMHSVAHATFSYSIEGFEGYEAALPELGAPERPEPQRSPAAPLAGAETDIGTSQPQQPQRLTHEASKSRGGRLSDRAAAAALDAAGSIDAATGFAVFSPHSLKERAQCGFRWFAKKMGLEDVYAGDDSALIIGNFLHGAYERAVRSITESDASFEVALDAALRSSAAKILAEAGPGLRPTISALIEKARHRLTELWKFERAVFGAYPHREFERSASHVFEAERAVLNGRIDCVFSRVDESLGGMRRCGIIDYKKNRIPTLTAMRPSAPGGERAEGAEDQPQTLAAAPAEGSDESEDSSLALSEIQIPSYALMLEMGGDSVEGALYWSIEKAKGAGYILPPGSEALPKRFGSAYATASDTAPARSALRAMLASAAAKLERGELLDRAADRASCGDCSFAPLCRYWYFLELP